MKSAFDERSIFPKYILDYEAKQRQLFESSSNQQQTAGVAPGNSNVQQQHQMLRQATEVISKFKRLNSSSTHSDPKAQ